MIVLTTSKIKKTITIQICKKRKKAQIEERRRNSCFQKKANELPLDLLFKIMIIKYYAFQQFLSKLRFIFSVQNKTHNYLIE